MTMRGRTRGNGGWTDERVAELKRLWALGWSAGKIAKQIGGVTRNSVVGKVHRLGINGRNLSDEAVQRQRTAYRESQNLPKKEKRAAGREVKPVVRPAPISDRVKPTAMRTAPDTPIFNPMRGESLPPIHVPEPVVAENAVFPKVCGLPDALEARHPDQCCFPIGEPSSPAFSFCTNRHRENSLYCTDHFVVTHQPLHVRESVHRRVERQARSA